LLIDPTVDKGLESNIYYTGTYEIGTLRLIQKYLAPGDTFIDVGANIGLMSIFASQCVGNAGSVLSFEANPDTLKILNQNISINNINNIKTSGIALGSQVGKGKIFSNLALNRGSASIVTHAEGSASYEIEIKPLDELLEPNQTIHLIKIDIEGYELEALKGMTNLLSSKNAPKLIVECGEKIEGVESSKESVFRFIKSINNYKIYKLIGGKGKLSKMVEITTESELPMHDNMICIIN
ncbi:MAG: FkbM family methyltransferase, partial [Bacteroidia bacterium]|nr:FkbM family methyltransferase [Bacteroidia bacterium]